MLSPTRDGSTTPKELLAGSHLRNSNKQCRRSRVSYRGPTVVPPQPEMELSLRRSGEMQRRGPATRRLGHARWWPQRRLDPAATAASPTVVWFGAPFIEKNSINRPGRTTSVGSSERFLEGSQPVRERAARTGFLVRPFQIGLT